MESLFLRPSNVHKLAGRSYTYRPKEYRNVAYKDYYQSYARIMKKWIHKNKQMFEDMDNEEILLIEMNQRFISSHSHLFEYRISDSLEMKIGRASCRERV
jgi:hypothetical protein